VVRAFDWRDGERLIRFGRGVAADAVAALGGPGYQLFTTSRAGAVLPAVAEAAAGVHHVAAGEVPELAAAALEETRGDGRIVALGGGRVIDVAKAVAAARGVRSGDEASGRGRCARAMAIPTTLSGAEMTRGHRHALGVPDETPRVRCAVVVCDPELAASQPFEELVASACNALGHAVEAPCTVSANPVATLAAGEAARLLIGAFDGDEPDREALALGALLAGYALDGTGLGLHHVMAQTLVRRGLAGHGQANAVLLPHTAAALRRRCAEGVSDDAVAGAARLLDLSGARVVASEAEIDACVEAAAARSELAATPPVAGREELRGIYAAALSKP
jgi:alcohol dehydrogenase class IV